MSAPILGFDLARLTGGDRVAAVLHRALMLERDDLAILAECSRNDADQAADWTTVAAVAGSRRDAWAVLGLAGGATPATPATPTVADETDTVMPAIAPVLEVLQRAPLGTLEDLLRCLRDEILRWTRTGSVPDPNDSGLDLPDETALLAISVLADALASAYVDPLPEGVRRRLGAPWVAASRRLPERPADLGPQGSRIREVIARAAALSVRDLARLEAVTDRWRRATDTWATAMHGATWAVHLQGRVRSAATAQLLLVEAVRTGGAPVGLLARGGWNLLSGAVQGLVVADLLDEDGLTRLLTPYIEAIGPTLR